MYILHFFVYLHIAWAKNTNLEVQGQNLRAICTFKEFWSQNRIDEKLGTIIAKKLKLSMVALEIS